MPDFEKMSISELLEYIQSQINKIPDKQVSN